MLFLLTSLRYFANKAAARILGHVTSREEGALAAHSGGSCQASISFDTGETFKVVQSFEGGCPSGASCSSNRIKDIILKFEFVIPKDGQSGPAFVRGPAQQR